MILSVVWPVDIITSKYDQVIVLDSVNETWQMQFIQTEFLFQKFYKGVGNMT